jgi:hypothetical protein
LRQIVPELPVDLDKVVGQQEADTELVGNLAVLIVQDREVELVVAL